ncbi:aldehyde dehydrogenase family protein [Cryobacterium sp. CG_9.6]|uniref:aldehyde dehydrogenase family protein n=1 Tax=Cryobacterium sp. CG_9.6 TaxID=2760710 RepID=UPI00247437D7|nr:aldehyde dehydrogenase family protein [Cryobacterium sp. CG_9.6]MDH6237805.1 acyl-CoA reductase-like NAD-dependent aldehyde dehydrogenase [Cryobacterium sp. CG_9.6]
MSLRIKPGTTWAEVSARSQAVAPEAFQATGLRNLIGGEWVNLGDQGIHQSPIDGTVIAGPPRVDHSVAMDAVRLAAEEHIRWFIVPLAERIERVRAAVDLIEMERELLALMLVWEIGKPWRIALADVDRCVDGVRWYLENISRQLLAGTPDERTALSGPVSNIASWNYPLSVQVHAELVQALAGNAVIAKTPSQGGFHALTLAHALMRRAGVPVTLISGVGSHLGEILIQSPEIGALAFVGGRSNGRKAAVSLADTGRRHILEQEGLNAWGIWDFSQWDQLAPQLQKGFEYAKQRCTAYPRYVVQRRLLPQFLDCYLPVVRGLRFGHPLAVAADDDPLPELDFGPVIHATKAVALYEQFEEALDKGAAPLYRGDLTAGTFLDGQDRSAYIAPATVLDPSRSWSLHHAEPFGPLDSIVLVDTEAELLAAMNVSNGNLVASIATDDLDLAARMSEELRAFKVGINKTRSRGDREEVFGGLGASWKGAFVGGDLLVRAVTQGLTGSEERLFGNFPDYSHLPARR